MKIAGAVLPYGGVLGGLLGLHSGWAAILGYHLAMGAVLVAAGGRNLLNLLRKGWNPGHAAALGAACTLSGALIWLLWPVMAPTGSTLEAHLAALGLSSTSWVTFVIYYSLVNPVLEELYWRGLYAEDTAWPAPSDLLYAGYHGVVLSLFVRWPWVVLALAIVAAAGWTWRQVARRTGGLLVPLVTHLVADVSIIVAALVLAR